MTERETGSANYSL